jgi:hypothetical protein
LARSSPAWTTPGSPSRSSVRGGGGSFAASCAANWRNASSFDGVTRQSLTPALATRRLRDHAAVSVGAEGPRTGAGADSRARSGVGEGCRGPGPLGDRDPSRVGGEQSLPIERSRCMVYQHVHPGMGRQAAERMAATGRENYDPENDRGRSSPVRGGVSGVPDVGPACRPMWPFSHRAEVPTSEAENPHRSGDRGGSTRRPRGDAMSRVTCERCPATSQWCPRGDTLHTHTPRTSS